MFQKILYLICQIYPNHHILDAITSIQFPRGFLVGFLNRYVLFSLSMNPDNLGRTIQGASRIEICGGDRGVLRGVSEGRRVDK